MECYCYLRNVRDKMVDGQTAFEKRWCDKCDGPSIPCWSMGNLQTNHIERLDKSPSVRKEDAEWNLLELCTTCGKGSAWSGDLLVADVEGLQETAADEVHVERFQSQDMFVKEAHEFACANGTLKLPNRPGASSFAEGNVEQDDDEIEDDEKDGSEKNIPWFLSGDFIDRDHEVPRINQFIPEEETFPDAAEVSRRDEAEKNEYKNNVFETRADLWTEAKDVNLSEKWTGQTGFQILRTWPLESDTWLNRPTMIQKTTRAECIWVMSAATLIQKSEKGKEKWRQSWKNAKLQEARRMGECPRCLRGQTKREDHTAGSGYQRGPCLTQRSGLLLPLDVFQHTS